MEKNNEREYYENMWENCKLSEVGCKSQYPVKAIEELLNFVGIPLENEIALDLGCGFGRHIKLLLEKGYSTIGADFSLSALKKIKENFPSVKTINCEATDISLSSSSVDLVLDSGCLHHIHPDFFYKYEQELSRIIKPEKHLIFYEFQVRDGKTQNWEGEHFTKYFTENELKQLFKNWKFICFDSVIGETGKPYWAGLLRKI
jgi:SAM-dependent methyltransferase